MAETPDSHDLDKLTRWHDALTSETGGQFPVCALFLASAEDRRAHDIFRVYRTAFEELGAGFHDLVIFGQHGVSSTSEALVPGLGLTGLRTPALALITGRDPPVCHTTVLPAGALPGAESEEEEDETPWKKALKSIREAVGAGTSLSLDRVIGLERRDFPGGSLAEAVGRVKRQVERA
jgi:hypothetical protein